MSFEDTDYTSINVVPVVELTDRLRTDRLDQLLAKYSAHFGGASPQFVVRVPGRVNLIGEHIDYCGYSVFPMALRQDILMAVGTDNSSSSDKGPRLRLANTQASAYPEVAIEAADLDVFPKSSPKWHHYFLCGYKGVVEKYCNSVAGEEGAEEETEGQPQPPHQNQPPPFNVMVDGSIPPGSGLSSSSAMVVASALSTLVAYYNSLSKISTPIPKLEIATLCIKCERYIGTDSGGMDQAIAVLAEEGSAKLIDFIPSLNATNVQLPAGVCFYIAHSGVQMHKAASSHYNTRVAETRLAAAVIAKRLKISGYKLGDQLWVVQQASASPLAEMADQLGAIFEAEKDAEGYSKEEICAILGIDEDDLEKIFLSRLSDPSVVRFKLHQRAKHVYEEAFRVQEFRRICETSKDVERLGQLMIESHESCRDLYECSHPKLDELVAIALDAGGAIGARLTGAGWGGCLVAMVYEAEAEAFEAVMSQQVNFLVRSGPSGGAAVYRIN